MWCYNKLVPILEYNVYITLSLWSAIIVFGRGSQIYKKFNKIATRPHPHPHPPPILATKILFVLIISLFEQTKHTVCGHLLTPYILVINDFMTYFFPKIMTQYIWDPLPKKMKAPLIIISLTYILICGIINIVRQVEYHNC